MMIPTQESRVFIFFVVLFCFQFRDVLDEFSTPILLDVLQLSHATHSIDCYTQLAKD